jgi:hypothetical protein
MERMAGSGAGGIDPNDLTNVLRGKKSPLSSFFPKTISLIGMNPNDFASLLSSFGGGGSGGAAGLMQGLRRGGTSTGTSTRQRITPSFLDTSAQQTSDSRPNTAPAGTRSVGTAATSTSRSNGSSSSATVPPNTGNSTTSSGSKSGSIQMSALTSVLANLGNNTTQETGAAASSSKPVIDLNDIITSEVRSIRFSFFYFIKNYYFRI